MFDRPIGATQIQQVRLADMLTEITKAQLLALQLGRLKDAGTFTPAQVSLAKRNNVNMACECAREARRLLGGNGILVEYHSMRHMANLGVGVHVRGDARRAFADPGAGDHGTAGVLGRAGSSPHWYWVRAATSRRPRRGTSWRLRCRIPL